MKSRFLFILILNFISLFVFVSNSLAYGIETHAGLTKEIFKYYNQEFLSNQIPEEFKNFLIEGSRREDVPPRWMHHFYDPVNNHGLQDAVLGYWTSSKEWAQDGKEQNKPIYKVATGIASLLSGQQEIKINWKETNFTWQQAIKFYVNGEKEKAFYALGHILHLIEDASVPDHTRNDPHPALDSEDHLNTGSPYELWTHRFNLENIDIANNLTGKKSIIFDNLNAYFDSMANYSNNNFYSKDTLSTSTYKSPEIDYIGVDGDYIYGFKVDDGGINYHLLRISEIKKYAWSKVKEEKFLVDPGQDFILQDYWRLLSTKAVQHGAGVINLFFQEVEKAKNDPNYLKEEKSFLGKIIDSVKNLGGQLISSIGKEDNFEIVETINLSEENNQNKEFIKQQVNQKEIVQENKTEEVFEEKIILPLEKKAEEKIEERKNEEKKSEEKAAEILPQEPEVKTCSFNTNQLLPARSIVINEVAWMGSVNSANDEWFELKNISNDIVDISDWRIFDRDEQINITIPKITKLYPQAIYLLERGSDSAVPGTAADYIYESAGNGAPSLKNSDEGLRIFDGNCNLMDEVLVSSNWPAGDNSSKATMERRIDLSWQTSSFSGGTPRQENSSGFASGGNSSPAVLVSGGSSSSQDNQENNQGQNNQVELPNVIITEIMYDLDGSDSGREWIEIFNKGNQSADLTGLKLYENDTNHSLSVVKGNGNLADGAYAVISDNTEKFLEDWPDYSGLLMDSVFSLKNDGEIISIKSGDNKLDEISYSSESGAAGNGNSLQLIDNVWQESEPTPGAENKISAAVDNQAPSAFFVSRPPEVFVGDNVNFDASPSEDLDGQIVYFEWDFGDGSSATSVEPLIEHVFSRKGSFEVKLTVFDDENAFDIATSSISAQSKEADGIVISEIQAGTNNGAEDEFVELYNPTDEEIDLAGWELRKRTSGETETNLVDDEKFTGIIKSKSFFLIAHPGYKGNRSPDLLYSASSTNLAYSDNTVILYNGDHAEAEVIDEVIYSNIEKNKSIERKAYTDGDCVLAQVDGEFLGNSCGNADFDLREAPSPQNSSSLSEPRVAPAAPEFSVSFDQTMMRISLFWNESSDFRGTTSSISYLLKEGEEQELYNGSGLSFAISISEVGKLYEFSLQAVDEDGLSSEVVSREFFAPSFFDELNFIVEQPENASSSTQYTINAKWNDYPFIPIIFKHTQSGQYSPNNWHAVIFYYNQPAERTGDISWAYFNQEDPPYNAWGLRNVPGGLKITYPNCAGSVTDGYSLILADKEQLCVPSGYYRNNALKFDELTDNEVEISVSDKNFSSSPAIDQDYITAAFYAYRPGAEPRNYTLGFVAVDKTKYYLKTTP